MNTTPEIPEPVFTDTVQIGIVVRDLEEALHTYVYDYGIAPWEVYEMNSSTVEEMTKDERPEDYAMRVALAMVGNVQWELIEPIGENNIYAEFLRDRGEGLHHIGMAVADYDETLERLRARGHRSLQAGKFFGALFSYPSTDRDMKVITEIFKIPDVFPRKPVYVYPNGHE
jgi:hypothetical protein